MSHRRVSAVLICARAVDAGQAISFCPAVVHLPVHCVLCIESHVFLFPAACLTDIPGKYRSVRYPLIRSEERFSRLLPCFVPGRVAAALYVLHLYGRD